MLRAWLTRRLARAVDGERIARAVAAAEARSSGEIAVSISPFFWGSVEAAARRAFGRLHVAHTRERNGVLLFVVPSRRTFMILGDHGVHARVGQPFWDETARALGRAIHGTDLTTAICQGVTAVGDALAAHFPAGPAEMAENELADRPDVGRS